tara:strand:- start:317 stop:1195 length:879 start_codon:yes stop_codon:yes gene_type:complete
MEIDDRLIGRRTFLTSLGFAGGTIAVDGYTPTLLAQSRKLETVSLGEFKLYYEVHGEGPPVIFAHGAGGTHLSWWQQIPAMSEHFKCVTFDHRGFGYSRDVGDRPGSAAFIDDLHALLDYLGIDRVGLIGQSMGGRTVLGFASAYPERVSALILCDTTGGYTDPTIERLLRQQSIERSPFAPSFIERHPERAFLYREIQRLTLERELAAIRMQVEATPTEINPIIEYEIPTLFIVGEEDTLVAPAVIEAMHDKIPHSEFAVVPEAGHSVYYERPKMFNRLTVEFLKRHMSDE